MRAAPLSLLLIPLACRPPEPPPEDTAPDSAGAEAAELPALFAGKVAVVEIALPTPDPALPRGAELSGLVTALLELGLADLDGVVPRVQGAPPSPGLAEALLGDAERWTASLTLAERGEQLDLRLSLCALDTCEVLASDAGTRAEPAPGVAALVSAVADHLLRGEAPGAADERALPTSADPYAVLLTGRSAATFYGILPAPPEEKVGDKRRDPVARALLVDPETAVGNWIAGRRALGRGEPEAARDFFTRASFARPTSDLLMADEAAALRAGGHDRAAWYALSALEGRRPADLRFTLATAGAALAAEQPQAAEDRLGALPEPAASDPAVLARRVDALAALHREAFPTYDALLARWATVAPMDAEPVRRRVQLRVREGAFEAALPLAAELSSRGATDEAATLELALLNALDRPEQAAARASALGQAALARRLSASASSDPAVIAADLAEDEDPRALAVRAVALVESRHAAEGLAVAEAALERSPWAAEPLAAQVSALDALGRPADAAKARARLCAADPRWPGCS